MIKYILLLIIFLMKLASAQFPVAAFWQLTNPFLRFTTLPQSLASYNCSGVMTVQASDTNGNAVNVMPDLTVSLSGDTGLTYYSDSACLVPITEVTILSGTSSNNFYFTSETTGLVDVIASATGFDNALQTETITADQFIWIGAGGDANWSTGANWLGGVAPGTSNTAIFSDYCVSNCSPQITSNINVKGVKMFSPYSGTIAQSGANTITIGTAGWNQAAGTFVGGSGAFNVSIYLIVNGGSFTATSGLTKITTPRRFTLADSSFTHNSGSIEFSGGNFSSSNPSNINTGNNSINDLNLTFPIGHLYMDVTNVMKVDGNLSTTLAGTTNDRYFRSGTIEVKGNVNLGGTTTRGLWGSGVVKLVGNPSGQTITGVANSRISNLEIDTGVHPVTLSGTVAIHKNFIVTSAGTITTTGSTLLFSVQLDTGPTGIINPGSIEYDNVTFASTYSAGKRFNLLSDFIIKGDLIIAGTSTGNHLIDNKLIVEGNVTMSNTTAASSTTTLELAGTNNQTATTNTTSGYRGPWVVNKPSGTVTLVNNLVLDGIGQDLTIQSGTLSQNGYSLTVSNNSGIDNVLTIDPGAILTQSGGTLITETLINNGTINP